MRINKQKNQNSVNNFKQNKYITKLDITDSLSWIDPLNHSKGTVEEYVYAIIETNINTIQDLDIFMNDFFNNPISKINVDIKHNIKDMYTTDTYLIAKITSTSLDKKELKKEDVKYKIIY